MYTWLKLNSIADLVKLEKELSPEFGAARVAKKLAGGISNAVKGVLIERNYVDKDYRSTYYNFYAKKGQHFTGPDSRPPPLSSILYRPAVDKGCAYRLGSSPDAVGLTDHHFGYSEVLQPDWHCDDRA